MGTAERTDDGKPDWTKLLEGPAREFRKEEIEAANAFYT